jgi:hypothetical protein
MKPVRSEKVPGFVQHEADEQAPLRFVLEEDGVRFMVQSAHHMRIGVIGESYEDPSRIMIQFLQTPPEPMRTGIGLVFCPTPEHARLLAARLIEQADKIEANARRRADEALEKARRAA